MVIPWRRIVSSAVIKIFRNFPPRRQLYSTRAGAPPCSDSHTQAIRTLNSTINRLIKTNRIHDAREVFDRSKRRNTGTWNSMLNGYVKHREMTKARTLFDEMTDRDIFTWNIMISGYVGSRYIEEGRYLFDRMPQRDFVSWNTMMSGYAKNGRMEQALSLFRSMPKRDVVSWNTMIMCYVKAGDIASARELFDQMTERDAFSWNTIISGYMHVSDMEEALNLFAKMPNPNVLSWNTIIVGYEKKKDYEGAIELFIKMQFEGEKPDGYTLSSLLSVCAESDALCLGVQIHQLVRKLVSPDVALNNSLITMYARCGAITEAKSIFDEMKLQRNVISWNAMIGGYASHGYAGEALELFSSMNKQVINPTYITFISVLNACANAGLVEQGRMHFNSMICEFGIEPRVEHFASLVDVVGRHGQVEEAMDVINSMPCKPNKAVWGALLGACKMHNNVKLALVAAEALMRLEPKSSAPYVLLFNMYADIGQWNDATEVRLLMKKNNIRKESGHSRVDSSAI